MLGFFDGQPLPAAVGLIEYSTKLRQSFDYVKVQQNIGLSWCLEVKIFSSMCLSTTSCFFSLWMRNENYGKQASHRLSERNDCRFYERE